MDKDVQSTKWLLTINNPDDHNISIESLKETLQNMPLRYTCVSKEIGESGTPHFHIFIYTKSPMRFSTVKNRFPTAHIDKSQGTAMENRDYVKKEGKWAETDKAQTSVPGTFWEWGDLPTPAEEKSPDNASLIAQINAGCSNIEILNNNPKYVFKLKEMDLLRQTLLSAKYRVEHREVSFSYLFGPNAEQMTQYIYDQYGAQNICRIISYKNKSISFDSYTAEDVLLLERFQGNIPLRDVLMYCSGYPSMLPARYSDRVACYTKLFITSDIAPDLQYTSSDYSPIRADEFYQRIDEVIEFLEDGTMIERKNKKDARKEEKNDL